MKLIVVLDNKNGMLFHNRRQSQDRILRKKILELASSERLWMNEYSANQFKDPEKENIIVREDFLEQAGKDDFCFVENLDVEPYQDKIDQIILFRWNRDYPGDFYFSLSLSDWEKIEEKEFEGNSHKKITMEVYKK